MYLLRILLYFLLEFDVFPATAFFPMEQQGLQESNSHYISQDSAKKQNWKDV